MGCWHVLIVISLLRQETLHIVLAYCWIIKIKIYFYDIQFGCFSYHVTCSGFKVTVWRCEQNVGRLDQSF